MKRIADFLKSAMILSSITAIGLWFFPATGNWKFDMVMFHSLYLLGFLAWFTWARVGQFFIYRRQRIQFNTKIERARREGRLVKRNMNPHGHKPEYVYYIKDGE